MDLTIEKIIVLLFLMLIPSFNYIVFTEANSTDTSSNSHDESESNHPGTSHNRPKSGKRQISWTPEMRSELIYLWEESNPLQKGYEKRLHQAWTRKHGRYPHITPNALSRNVQRFIKRHPFDDRYLIRSRILNKKTRFPWTPELKNSAIECLVQSKRNRTVFKRLWDERHPQYAHLDYKYLKDSSKNFKFLAKRGKMKTKNHTWNEELNAEMRDVWDETYKSDSPYGHTEKISREWKRRHPDFCRFSPKYLKLYANTLIKEDTAKRLARGERSENLQRRMKYIEHVNKRLYWKPKMISDLLKCHRMYKNDPKARLKCWQELQPKYAYLDISHLSKMAHKFLREKDRKTQGDGNRGKQPKEVIDEDDIASSSGTLQLSESTASHYRLYAAQFGASQYEVGESSKGILRPRHFITADTHLNSSQPEGSHWVHDTVTTSSSHTVPEHQYQQRSELQEDRTPVSLREQSQRSKSREVEEDLDLELHLK